MSNSSAAQFDDLDMSSLMTPPVTRVGGGLSLLSGIITALTSLQTISITSIRGPLAAAPYLLASGAWLVISVLGGLFSLFALVDPALALLAGAVAAASVAPCSRVTAARKVGDQAGFGLGI